MKKVLGKGISALIPQVSEKPIAEPNEVNYLPINEILPNPYQPRENPEEDLSDLITSIKEKGILQPIIVRTRRQVSSDQITYELVVGERRLRAARAAGLTEIPTIVKEISETEMLEWALIENIQRTDLNPIEEARGYKRLVEDFGMTHEMIAEKVGKDRSTITNALRLLTLPDSVQNYLRQGKITTGHARALLALSERKAQEMLCERIVREGLSVRQVEELCYPQKKSRVRTAKTSATIREKDIHITDIEEKLQEYLRTRVRINKTAQKGTVVIEFYSDDDLTRLVKLIMGERQAF
ncbi:MAG: ParB/RepB/Spo0J family partition protein [candidate division WOR-3 bacterium]|nr:ParB/RepB/Spo0J family partition protein [candidate division WOR-3 bacterium]